MKPALNIGRDVRAVLFDMDGVLIDSEPIYFEIEQQSFAHFGVTVGEEEHHSYVGTTLESMWRSIRHRHRLSPPVEELLAYHQERVLSEMGRRELRPTEGVERFVRSLSESKIKAAVASSSSHALIDIILNRTGLRSLFTVCVSGEDVERGKPEPDIFLRAAALLGLAPSACLVIEDSFNGIRAARKAGMSCVGFKNPNSGKQDLSLADSTIDRFLEISWGLSR